MKTTNMNELKEAIRQAAQRLENSIVPSGPPAPGDLYVFPSDEKSITLEWLLVRFLIDDPNISLLVPGDNFPFAGSADICIPSKPVIFHCGHAEWVNKDCLKEEYRVSRLEDITVSLVRRKMAELARGIIKPVSVDDDVNYIKWMEEASYQIHRTKKLYLKS